MNFFKKSLIIILVIFALSLLLVACQGESSPEPAISITSGDLELKPISYGDRYNESREDIENGFAYVFDNSSFEDLPYISLEDEVVIKLDNFESDELELYDAILSQDGKFKYQDKVTSKFNLVVENGEVTFKIPINNAAMLSSNSADYEPGHTIRAFIIRTKINKSDFAFAFVIRTDAK